MARKQKIDTAASVPAVLTERADDATLAAVGGTVAVAQPA